MKKVNVDKLIELMERNVELLEVNVRASERINDRLDKICGDMGSDVS